MVNDKFRALFKDKLVKREMLVVFERFYADGTDLIIDESMIHGEEFSLQECLCSSECITLGACESAEVTFTMSYDEALPTLVGHSFIVKFRFNGSTTDEFNLGRYKVLEDKHDASRTKRTIKAYDAIHELLELNVTSWYNNLYAKASDKYTIKAIRDSFFTYAKSQGIDAVQENTTLCNDNVLIGRGIDATSTILGKDIIIPLCEINGVFGHIDRLGLFVYKTLVEPIQGLYPSETVFPSETLFPMDTNIVGVYGGAQHYRECTYEDYICQHIDLVQICTEDGDVGGSSSSGQSIGVNGYKIVGNVFAIGASVNSNYQATLNSMATNIFNFAKRITYMPSTLSVDGDPCIEVGDLYRCITINDINVTSYVLQRTLKGVKALIDEFVSTGTEYISHDVSKSIQSDIKRVAGRTNVLIRTVDEMSVTISGIQGNYSAIKQTVDKISLEVFDSKGNSRITQNANSIEAKVSKEGSNSDKSFSWELKSSGFILKRGTTEVFKCTSSGVTVQGTINATSGFIGSSASDGWTIAAKAIYNTKGSLSSKKDGVYIGTDGIALGSGTKGSFSVTHEGVLTCKEADISGKITADSGVFDNVVINESCTVKGQISAANITSGTLSMDRIGSNAIGGGKISDNAIGSRHIAQTVVYEKLTSTDKGISCGKISVGAHGAHGDISWYESDPSINKYVVLYAGANNVVKWKPA